MGNKKRKNFRTKKNKNLKIYWKKRRAEEEAILVSNLVDGQILRIKEKNSVNVVPKTVFVEPEIPVNPKLSNVEEIVDDLSENELIEVIDYIEADDYVLNDCNEMDFEMPGINTKEVPVENNTENNKQPNALHEDEIQVPVLDKPGSSYDPLMVIKDEPIDIVDCLNENEEFPKNLATNVEQIQNKNETFSDGMILNGNKNFITKSVQYPQKSLPKQNIKQIIIKQPLNLINCKKQGSEILLKPFDIRTLVEAMCINPYIYFGLEKTEIHMILREISDTEFIDDKIILLILRKLRKNESLLFLSKVFQVNKVISITHFLKSIVLLSEKMKIFLKLEKDDDKKEDIIVKKLPLCFKYEYRLCESILHCLEIEIPESNDYNVRDITWSLKKDCCTIKYLISCTPTGAINFVSEGYPGSTSIHAMVKSSSYLNSLRSGSAILASREFRSIETLLQEKQCKLLQFPSFKIQMNENSTRFKKIIQQKEFVLEPIKRILLKLKEFEIIKNGNQMQKELLCVFDEIMIILCALINLQTKLNFEYK